MKYRIQVRKCNYTQRRYSNLLIPLRTWKIVFGFAAGWQEELRWRLNNNFGYGVKEVLITKFGKGVKGYKKVWHGYLD